MKILFSLFYLAALLLIFPFHTQAQTPTNEKVIIYLFHSESCPHCKKERAFFESLDKESLQIEIREFEVSNNRNNALLLKKIGETLDLPISTVPITIIGNKTINGYGSDDTTGKQILNTIEIARGQPDIVAPIINSAPNESQKALEETVPQSGAIHLPFFGNINPSAFSLPLLTIIIAAVDGFNPCAMWVLLFLISLLLGMKDRKRMWILGSTFIFASAFIYFLFLSAWLNLLMFIGFISWVRGFIGLVAAGAGTYNIYDFITNKNASCTVTGSSGKKKIIERLKQITGEKYFWHAFIGIILLAFSVNLFEAVCSAGLPAIYSQILTLNELPVWQYYAYLLLYVFIFMLDDLLVFGIAMKTLSYANIGTKYAHWARLIGGIVLLLIGLAILFKPEYIMFG